MNLPTRHMADVSSNNARYEPAAYRAAGHTRVAIKATEGLTYANPRLDPWAERSHDLGMSVSFYHYCRPGTREVLAEANHFWRHVKPLWLPGDKLHLDLEAELDDKSVRQTASYLLFFHKYLHSASGRVEIPYMDANLYSILAGTLAGEIDWYWIADYSSAPPSVLQPHKLWGWQFTNGLSGPEPHEASGVGACDLSLLNRGQVLNDYLRLLKRRGHLTRHR